MKTLMIAAAFFGLLNMANAANYDTYAGDSSLVTTAQTEQMARENQSAAAFRGMSIADRWDSSAAGSIEQRWNPNQFGSIARRWAK